MKKSIIIAGLFCFALNAVAAVTPTGKLNIAISSANQDEKVLRLRQHDTFSDAFDNGWDAEAVTDGGIYVLAAGTHYTTWASNEFANLPVSFGAIEDTDYTLTFSNFGGQDITFTDLLTGTQFTLSSSVTYPYVYNFSITDAQKNTAVDGRFVINFQGQSLCFTNNILEVNGHAGESLIIKQGDTELVTIPSLGNVYAKDLSQYTGRLVVILNGQKYQIDANPEVTPANP